MGQKIHTALQCFFRRDGNDTMAADKSFLYGSQFPINVLRHGGVYLGGAVQTGGFAFLKI